VKAARCVGNRRESFVLMRGNKPIAELRPLPTGKRLAELPGLFTALPRLSAAEAGHFADDLDEARAALVEEFLASPHAPAVGEARSIVYRCLEARCDYSDGDPLRWSPIVVELFMLDYLPPKALLKAAEVDALPEVLTAWVRFALSKHGLAERLVVETEDAVRDLAPEYLEAVREPANFGPAKAMLGALEAASIDLTDQQAIDAWVAEFNARPRHERDAIMGVSPFPDDSDPAT